MAIKKVMDISEFQTITSWGSVKSEVDAVIIRCGLRSAGSDPKIRYDNKFKSNLAAVKKYGIPYSLYFFPTSITAAEAHEEAAWIKKCLIENDVNLSLPLYLDSENVYLSSGNGRSNALSPANRTKYLKIVCDDLMSIGIPCGIYASTSWLGNRLNMKDFPYSVQANTWVAQYAAKCTYTGPYAMWQYTSKAAVTGVVTGSDRRVDMSTVTCSFAMLVSPFKTTEPVKISNSGSDERGKYSGGTAGDQTGNEWVIRNWYDRPWNCVLRHPNPIVRCELVKMEVDAANNNHIGYDQSQRQTYWEKLKQFNYEPSKITANCESDCSAGVIANVRGVGYKLGIKQLQNLNATYTGNMRAGLKEAGFMVLTDKKYLTSSKYLIAGDILLNDAHHTAVAVTNGTLSSTSEAIPVKKEVEDYEMMPEIKKGSKGKSVIILQIILGGLTLDGDFGDKTLAAVKAFQKKQGLTQDGVVGPKTWEALIKTL